MEQNLRPGVKLEHHAQNAVLLGRRLCHHPLGDLELHGHDGAANTEVVVAERKEDLFARKRRGQERGAGVGRRTEGKNKKKGREKQNKKRKGNKKRRKGKEKKDRKKQGEIQKKKGKKIKTK